jgi:hypothetical protein
MKLQVYFLFILLEVSFCLSAHTQTIIRKEEPILAGVPGGEATWENHEQPLGSGGYWGFSSDNPNGTVFSITHDYVNASQGQIVAGSFDSIGSTQVNRIGYSDNGAWKSFGSGIQNGVIYSTACAYFHPGHYQALLFAGGTFTMAGGIAVHQIAMWDGSAWHSLGNGVDEGVDSTILAMAVIGDSLFVGGNFTHAGGKLVNHIAIWNIDSNRWEQIIDNGVVGVDGGVAALLVPYQDDRKLYAGGGFLTAGSTPASKIAELNDGHWNSLGTGVTDKTGAVEALCESFEFSSNLHEIIAGGHFQETNPSVTNLKIWRPKDSTWSTINAFLGMKGTIYTLTDPFDLFVGGDFTLTDSSKYFLAIDRLNLGPKVNGAVYASLGEGGFYPEGYSERIYIGGNFSIPQHHFAIWSEGSEVELNQNTTSPDLIVFPNPVTNNSILRIKLQVRSSVKLVIYNLIGKEVFTIAAAMFDTGTHDFNLSDVVLQSGSVFLAKLNVNGDMTTRQLIKF